MLEGINAGDTIKCTITADPRSHGAHDTLVRLMQSDPGVKKALARTQKLRRQRMHTYIRGNRLYYSREKCSNIAHAKAGATWEMTFFHDIAPDLASVEQYVKVEKA